MRNRLLSSLLVFAAFFALAMAWSFASPPGSTNDEEYHLANIWCAWGEWEGCQFSVDGATGDRQATASGSVWIPEFVRSVNCYQRGTQSVECLQDKGSGLVNSYRQGYGYNPTPYYLTMRSLVWSNDRTSLQLIRIANVVLTGSLLAFAVFVSSPFLRRGVMLAWGLVAIPWVVLYASSSNPSAWTIAGVGTIWAFALSALDTRNSRAIRIAALAGSLFSAALATLGRFDGIGWLAIAVTAILIYTAGTRQYAISRWVSVAFGTLISLLVVGALRFNWTRLGFSSFGFPEWNRATDQPFPPLKDLLEFPWWFWSFFGAQPSTWVPANAEPQSLQDGFITLSLATNLGDFFFPSAVGYMLGFSAFALLFVSSRHYSQRNWILLLLLFLVLVSIVILFRTRNEFGPQVLQNRYFLPWLMIFMSVGLTNERPRYSLLSRGQALTVGALLTVGGSLAWLAFAGRYAVQLSGTFTNFGQDPVWWWPWGPSRLVWFGIASLATLAWYLVVVQYAVRPIRDLDRSQISRY